MTYIALPPEGSASWKDSVANAAALPATGNTAGDARAARDTGIVYVWTGASWASSSGSGTVTSVAMTVPSIMSVAGSPVTGAGTLAVTLATETANTVFSGPTSGGAATPTFRSLVAADIPSITAAKVSDFQTAVSANSNVVANTAAVARLAPVNDPANYLYWQDDFDAQDFRGSTNWSNVQSGGALGVQTATQDHPGITKIGGTTATTGYGMLYRDEQYTFGSASAYTFDTLIQIPTLSTGTDEFTVRVGFQDGYAGIDANDGAYFEYTHTVNSGQWVCKTAINSVRTTTNTSVAASAGAWVHLQIQTNAAGTSVTFYINGTLVATNTTNIPGASNPTGLAYQVTRGASTGATRYVYTDVAALTVAFSTPRW
jgi:hypothetical protein